MRIAIVVGVAFVVALTVNGVLAADETQSVEHCTCEIACNCDGAVCDSQCMYSQCRHHEVQMEYEVHNWYHFCWQPEQAGDAANLLSETAELDEELMAFLLWYWFGASE